MTHDNTNTQTFRKTSTYAMVVTALMAAVTCILAPLSVPIGPVPISLTNFAIYLSLYLLDWKKGTLSYLIYLLLGLVGLPVFSGFTGGLAKLAGPTGGYIIGYIFMALVIGLIVTKTKKKFYIYLLAMVAGTIVCYTFGTAWYVFSTKTALLPALTACVFPFLPGDAIKIILASLIACQLQKHIKLS